MRRNDGVECMAIGLWSAMDSEVLRSRHNFEISRIRALQATDEGGPNLSGEEGIFSVGLLTAAPSRITNDVDVRGPEREAIVDRVIVFTLSLVVFGSRLG